MKLTLIANLKSNKTSKELQSWLQFFHQHLQPSLIKQINQQLQLFVAPPAPYFHLFSSATPFSLLAQDVSPFPPGTYTGAINYLHLLDFQVKGSLVGHSERRHYFHETNQDVVNKIELLLDNQLLPIVCLNETNLTSQIEAIPFSLRQACLFAYEPTSAIGTQHPADPQQVAETFKLITRLTETDSILYGGSVNSDNLQDYLNLPHFGGFLVGGASLHPQSLFQLITQLIN